jgi:hypothetical protein
VRARFFGSSQLALDKRLEDHHLGSDICEPTSLPSRHMLAHGPEVTLLPVDTHHNAVNQREQARVFCKNWRKHATNGQEDVLRATLTLQVAALL